MVVPSDRTGCGHYRAKWPAEAVSLVRPDWTVSVVHPERLQAGFLGDELPSEGYPNQALLDKALRDIRPGDILMAHLGIWSRHDPWAPAVLEPLIVGLQQRGFCFRTLREHPDYAPWIAAHGG